MNGFDFSRQKDLAHAYLAEIDSTLEAVQVLISEVDMDLICTRLPKVQQRLELLQVMVRDISKNKIQTAINQVQHCIELRRDFLNLTNETEGGNDAKSD